LDLDSVHWLQDYLREYEGVLIVISRPPFPQQCLHSHRRHRLRNHHHVQRRLRRHGHGQKPTFAPASNPKNSQREKKIAQLNEFIARFSAGTRSAQATPRKKEVERLQTTELARSNIQRPYIRFDMKRASGRHPLEVRSVEKSYDGLKVIPRFSASVTRGEKIALMGRNGTGKTTLLEIAGAQCHRVHRRFRS